VTVTRAVAWIIPPVPFAVSVYVVEPEGVRLRVPLGVTAPRESMLTSVEFFVLQLSCTD
jgi:hypothetical protein